MKPISNVRLPTYVSKKELNVKENSITEKNYTLTVIMSVKIQPSVYFKLYFRKSKSKGIQNYFYFRNGSISVLLWDKMVNIYFFHITLILPSRTLLARDVRFCNLADFGSSGLEEVFSISRSIICVFVYNVWLA